MCIDLSMFLGLKNSVLNFLIMLSNRVLLSFAQLSHEKPVNVACEGNILFANCGANLSLFIHGLLHVQVYCNIMHHTVSSVAAKCLRVLNRSIFSQPN